VAALAHSREDVEAEGGGGRVRRVVVRAANARAYRGPVPGRPENR